MGTRLGHVWAAFGALCCGLLAGCCGLLDKNNITNLIININCTWNMNKLKNITCSKNEPLRTPWVHVGSTSGLRLVHLCEP